MQIGKESSIVGKRHVRFRKFFVCDLLTLYGFSGRNFVRGVICTLKALNEQGLNSEVSES